MSDEKVYRIKESTLQGFAEQTRRLACVERTMCPPDMLQCLEGVVPGTGGGDGENSEQMPPEIFVSEDGLITATANGKSSTKQLPVQHGKMVVPKSSEQIAVAAGNFVTGDVKVAAVEGGASEPFCQVIAESQNPYIANIHAKIITETSVLVERYYTHALYNGVRLPRIPDGVLASYPYVFIRHNTTSGFYEMYCATGTTYYSSPNICFSTSTARQRYRIAIATAETATEWASNGTSTANVTIDSARPVLWSNHDIPSGSATATDIYFECTEPVLTD